MTTICYNHRDKQIACDSRSTNGSLIVTDSAMKMIEVNGVKFWLAGPLADKKKFTEMYFGAKLSEFYPDNIGFVLDGQLYLCGVDNGELWKEPVDCNMAVGSGQSFALSAMHLGMSAKQAVEHTKVFDCWTGGEVHVFDIYQTQW